MFFSTFMYAQSTKVETLYSKLDSFQVLCLNAQLEGCERPQVRYCTQDMMSCPVFTCTEADIFYVFYVYIERKEDKYILRFITLNDF